MTKLAYSSLCCRYIDDILSLAVSSKDKAIEWDMNFIPPTLSKARNESILSCIQKNHLDIRYHLPYSFWEIAHIDPIIRAYSISSIKQYLEYICRLHGRYAILHIGYDDNSDEKSALQSLQEIARYAKTLDIHVCMENLTKGLTTSIGFIKRALETDNVYICIDTGHAQVVSSLQKGYCSALCEVIEKCVHAHVYFTEDQNYNHIAFDNILQIETSSILSALHFSNCDWYTMELDKKIEQEKQMNMLHGYIEKTL